MVIVPIALTGPLWTNITKIFGTTYEPLRCLDNHQIPINEPKALLGILGFNDQPLENIRDNEYLYNHIHITFMLGPVYEEDVLLLTGYGNIKAYTIEHERTLIAVATGSLYDWKQLILFGCKRNTPHRALQKITSQLYYALGKVKLDEVFYYNKVKKNAVDDVEII